MDSKQFIELLENCGYEPRSYSGRFMYGAKCVGVPLNGDELEIMVGASLMDQAHEVGIDVADIYDTLSWTKDDSLGRGSILYWPKMLWPEEEDDE